MMLVLQDPVSDSLFASDDEALGALVKVGANLGGACVWEELLEAAGEGFNLVVRDIQGYELLVVACMRNKGRGAGGQARCRGRRERWRNC